MGINIYYGELEMAGNLVSVTFSLTKDGPNEETCKKM